MAYTCMLRNSTLAAGVCGARRTENAVKRAVQKATVVKKPKTFCALTKVECILVLKATCVGVEHVWYMQEIARCDSEETKSRIFS